MIRVRDNGIGIRPEILPHIFDPFCQSPRAVDHASGGLGIGLALVRQLVGMHGGSVVPPAPVPVGSEFGRSTAPHHSRPTTTELSMGE